MKTCGAGPIPARFNQGQARPLKIKHCQAGSGYTSYKVYSRTASFPGRRFFSREKRQRRCGKERTGVSEVQINSGVTYQKRIAAKEPDTHAEITLKFEGLKESKVLEMLSLFKQFAAEVEGIVLEEVNLV